MTVSAANGEGRRVGWSLIGWGGAGLLLLVPLILNFPWDAFDFVFAGILFAVVGVGLELVFRLNSNGAYRAGACVAILAGFLTIWANGAVGMIGNEDNPYNLVFLGVVAFALVGAAVVRLRPAGMAVVIGMAAAAQFAGALGGVTTDVRGAVFSAAFTGFWGFSALFFRKAAQDSRKSAAGND